MKQTKKLMMLISLLVALPFTTSCMLTPPIPGRPEESSQTEVDKPVETSQGPIETVTTPNVTETEVAPNPNANNKYAVAYGTFAEFGGGKVELYLLDTVNCVYDLTLEHGPEQFNKMLDVKGTYSITNGVIETVVDIVRNDIPNKVAFPAFLSYDGSFTINYVLYGEKEIQVPMMGVWPEALKQPLMSGKFSDGMVTTGTVDLILNDTQHCTFDMTFDNNESFNKVLDVKGKYNIINGEIICYIHYEQGKVPSFPQEYVPDFPERNLEFIARPNENGELELAYTAYDFHEYTAEMKGRWPQVI